MVQWVPNLEQFRLITTWADKKWDYYEQGECAFSPGILKTLFVYLKHYWDIWSMGSITYLLSLRNVYCLGNGMIYLQQRVNFFSWNVGFKHHCAESVWVQQNPWTATCFPHQELSISEHFYIGLTENEMWPRPYLSRLWVKAGLKHQWFPKDSFLNLCFLLVFFSKLQAFE